MVPRIAVMEELFGPDHLRLQESVRHFAQKEIRPLAADIDLKHQFPKSLIPKLAEMGLMGIEVSSDFGGAGMDTVSYVIAVEEISKACASTGVIVSVNNSLVCGPIEKYGTDVQKKKYLGELATGKKLGCFGLTEANAGSDASGTKTTAVLKGDHYILNGTKNFITNGKEADVAVLFASTKPAAGAKGISAFILEKGMAGFSVGKVEKKLGIHGSSTTELVMENVKVPKENLLGKENEGFKVALSTLDSGRIGIASQALGIAGSALEAAVNYTKDRVQFGRPIAENQGLRWIIADMATRLDAARLLVYRAAFCKGKGGRYSKEAAMAKLYASETAVWVSNKALQLHGGYGYIEDYPVERFYRDAKITEIYEGTSEIQRIVIAQNVLGELKNK
jgi:butyryl-CoA dehydrogenase